jgi:competence protein ComEC
MPITRHLGPSVLCLLILLTAAPAGLAAGPAEPVFLTFFDVGQGDALLIHQPGRCAVLVDTGPPGSGRDIGTYLAEKGISRLDHLIISHPHQDHFGGVLGLPTDLQIGEVLDNGIDNRLERNYRSYRKWRARHFSRDLHQGDAWQCGRILFTVLGPAQASLSAGAINDSSLVLRVDIGAVGLLLPGDLEARGWQTLDVDPDHLNVEIFKVPHHGAADSHLGDRMADISPELSVVSASRGNLIGAPDRRSLEVIGQYSRQVWRTDLQGDLEIRIDEQGWNYVRQ